MMKNIIVAFKIVILLSFNIYSQQLSQMSVVGSAEFLPSEIIANEIKDANGDVCAGLIISTDLTGLSYDSYNGIVKMDEKPGRDLLYLSPNERVVRIYKSGFESLQIILGELDIKPQSGQVWQIKISSDIKIIRNFGKGSLTLSTDPIGAVIKIEEFPDFYETTPWTFSDYPVGLYNFMLTLNKYEPEPMLIEIYKDSLYQVNKTLVPRFAFLNCNINPKQANLYVDGVIKDHMNSIIELSTGLHDLEITLDHYYPYSKIFNLQPGETIQLTEELQPRYCIVDVISEPQETQGASIKIDNRIVGNTPLYDYRIIEGQHYIEIEKNGFERYYSDHDIAEYDHLKLNIRLKAYPKIEKIKISFEYDKKLKNREYEFPLPRIKEIFDNKITEYNYQVTENEDDFASSRLFVKFDNIVYPRFMESCTIYLTFWMDFGLFRTDQIEVSETESWGQETIWHFTTQKRRFREDAKVEAFENVAEEILDTFIENVEKYNDLREQ